MEICQKCGIYIQGASLYALGRHYHQNCFACSTCGTPIHGNFLTGRNNEPVCENCRPRPSGNRCARCLKPVRDTIVTALGKEWHPECFTCIRCNIRISGAFSTHLNEPVCPSCYSKILSGEFFEAFKISMTRGGCATCHMPIIEGSMIRAINKEYHKSCFICSSCKNAILGGFNTPDEKHIYCTDCYSHSFGVKCDTCHLPIREGEYTIFNMKKFHHSCFRCTICGKALFGHPLSISESGGACCVTHTDAYT